MRPALVIRFTVAPATAVRWAHPGVGLVRDARGNVYCTDLTQDWLLAKAYANLGPLPVLRAVRSLTPVCHPAQLVGPRRRVLRTW